MALEASTVHCETNAQSHPLPFQVLKAVRGIYENLDSTSEPSARHDLLGALILLGYKYTLEVVGILLHYSLMHDRQV